MPEEREKAGKSKKGVIRLGARRERNSVIIEVSDDGRGVSVSKVKKKAIEKGFITEDRLRTMSDDEIVSIIALPGFSTAENVNQVSGRGVGVDVVKTKVEAFGGIFKIENYPGEGMKSILKLPLTLAIIQALLVKVDKQTYSLPVLHTIETIEVETKDVKYIQERKVIVLREEVIPLVSLAELLNHPYAEKDVIQIVIVEVRDKKIAIEVDKVLGQQEVAIKSLGEMLKFAKGFSGVTILGDGRISLIVDIPSLL
jgi:two-component system chemotaxis sensor kinase CheA